VCEQSMLSQLTFFTSSGLKSGTLLYS